MNLSHRRRLDKLSARIIPSSSYIRFKKAERMFQKYLREAEPDEWDWILQEENLNLSTLPWSSKNDLDLNILNFKKSMAHVIAGTRGWLNCYGFSKESDWNFRLYDSYEKGEWGILFLMGLTPHQFDQLPEETRISLLKQARVRIELFKPELFLQFGMEGKILKHEFHETCKQLNLPQFLQKAHRKIIQEKAVIPRKGWYWEYALGLDNVKKPSTVTG